MLASADLLTPDGEIDGTLFYPQLSPSDVSTRISSYITQGYAKATAAAITDLATRDGIARAYAYYRAWSDVVNRLTLSPASASLGGEVSTSYLQTQINSWIVARDGWKAEYLSLIPTISPASSATGASVSVPTRTVF